MPFSSEILIAQENSKFFLLVQPNYYVTHRFGKNYGIRIRAKNAYRINASEESYGFLEPFLNSLMPEKSYFKEVK